jgi:alkylation response protein AidB-like acyl-CoA dehydrogenase
MGLTIFSTRDAEGIEMPHLDMGSRGQRRLLHRLLRAAENVVGEIGRGFPQIMAGLDGERLLGAAVGLGISQRALDDTITYVKERKLFGKRRHVQALRHRIADLAIELSVHVCSPMRSLGDSKMAPTQSQRV